MRKVLLFTIIVSTILVTIPVRADSGVLYVDDDGPADYSSIQEAIDMANPGDTVFVRAGTYHEHLTIHKSLTLIGEDPNVTVIDGSGHGNVVHVIEWELPICQTEVVISGFTIRNGDKGIYMWSADCVTISGNIITSNSSAGVYLHNLATGNRIIENIITSNYRGIMMVYYSRAHVVGNTIADNEYGISFWWPPRPHVFVYHNNLTNNLEQVSMYMVDHPGAIVWDNLAGGGNYWSDYSGEDDGTGIGRFGEPRAAGDGIGDTNIPHLGLDWYPFMEPDGWKKITAGLDLDPSVLNLKSEGKWVTAYIELPDSYDVADIDVSTVMLEGTIAAQAHPTEVGDYDDDGITDLMVKFDREALIDYLDGTTGDVTLTVGGELSDETPLEGSDTITIIDPGQE